MTQKRSLLGRIGIFIAFVFLQNLSTIGLQVEVLIGRPLSEFTYALVVSVIFLAVMVYFIKYYQGQLQEYNPRDFGENLSFKGKVGWIILTVVGIYAFLILVSPLLPQGTAENQQVVNQMFANHVLGVTLYGAVLGPIIEELLYRGIFMNFFWNQKGRLYDVLAVLSSGVIFGLLHEPQLSLYLVVYAAIGVFLGMLYLKTKDIRCNMIAHILYNGITFLVMFQTL
ncbi:type II CAAX endopeptidase family protein [Enterococcus asini]|uniref:CPBP family intramembrane glutamic endopeptidase n=1 Tax=Enterococcus asini TaxID=57732 RepID=UPI0028910426|nr:type II CAAX endopeptidase family protein [Enterococcus asini]MDT2757154.1 type II CAAX endopeptidase family protein [Enterococcus asini]